MMQYFRTGGECCGSQGPQASGREWMLGTPKVHEWIPTEAKSLVSSSQ